MDHFRAFVLVLLLLSILQPSWPLPQTDNSFADSVADDGSYLSLSYKDLMKYKLTLKSQAAVKPRGGSFAHMLKVNKGYHTLIKSDTHAAAVPCAICLWPSIAGLVKIAYEVSSNFTVTQRALIDRALQEITTMSCVHFFERTTENSFLIFDTMEGCWSFIGKIGGGQMISLDKATCMLRGQIQHEVLHALGFLHEVVRSDRDDYVSIIEENIIPDKLVNFIKVNNSIDINLPYDYGSVMHWDRYVFSNNGYPTIVPKLSTTLELGQMNGISDLDLAKINALYDCSLCRNMITSFSGEVTSTNFPSQYPNNANCLYMIRVPENQIFLTFEFVDIESSLECSSDYFRVYDGLSLSSPLLLDKTCGTSLPNPLVSSSNVMLFEFVTNESGTGTGFKASYTSVTCGAVYTSNNTAVTSPGFPSRYRNGMDCLFRIIAPDGYKISLAFNFFFMELASNCSTAPDYLSIYDGISTSTTLLARLCGYISPTPTVVSSGSNMMLRFVTDDYLSYYGFSSTCSFVPI